MLYELAIGYSKILQLITEPELGFYNCLILYKTTTTDEPTSRLSNQPFYSTKYIPL